MKNRVFLVFLAVVLVCCGGGVGAATWWWQGSVIDTVGQVDFTNRLAIPPLAPSHLDGQGRRVFELTAKAGKHDFGSGRTADTWGFDGDYLGPTLRAAKGEQVLVNMHNSLGEATTVHWHGMHLPAAMDGGPHQPVAPGATWSPTWTIKQPAATLWYHPHPHGETARHVYRGLAGMFILDDPAAPVDLPDEYGVDDIPVIVQDKAFDGAALDEGRALLAGTGILGDTIAVNGTVAPFLDVTTSLVRLRVLNASNARPFNFRFADGRAFDWIGTDGGLLAAPVSASHVQLSPGERAEIVVGVRAGERVVLRSEEVDLGGNLVQDRFVGGKDRFDVLELRGAAVLRASVGVPPRLVEMERLDPSTAVTTRGFSLTSETINGSAMSMERVDVTATLGTTEIWEITNRDGAPHNFHVHDVQFQVLGADVVAWKDTVFATPGETVRIVLRFTDYADPSVPYMYHCHLMYHEDQGMMGQFVVVRPGETASLHHH
ncbi:FtsP/CotA-like multicopper oxidase with cupredoxin domain [Allocatelliglobosispora scoriae]|uniref:FtsP/CotA-like multicopper oxidase with cupredoxin domain n=1 Tax=Allocatelliglobosispora scoriae TaxID=643052 RepID=A0A841BTX3_9ACTN|nr:multicopper oxidase domain-containing protein [Allocatelliglobosispora scoriae]MBB5872537.1 FtsP/CotA-like multicopper oxidase with cupredoxin domain [Allocatelliglobosispora scoriae]